MTLYSSLPDARSTRLLNILPSENPDAIVDVTLEVVLLDEAEDFEALSYCWGSHENPSEILCNGHTIIITRNLGDALKRLRKADAVRRMWVDAVSINQADVDERSQQVRFMKDIYARAWRVVVFLGLDEDNEAAIIIPIIEKVAGFAREEMGCEGDNLAEARDRTLITENPGTLKIKRDIDPVGHANWEIMRRFCQRGWFSRVWVVQEVAESDGAIMVIGDHSVKWSDVGFCSYWLVQKSFYVSLEQVSALARPFGIYHIWSNKIIGLENALCELLQLTYPFDATDPRDKIYAVIGLAYEGKYLDAATGIGVDYRKSVVETYGDAICYLITLSPGHRFGIGGLDALGDNVLANLRLDNESAVIIDDDEDPDRRGFPSWIPRWTRPVSTYPPLSFKVHSTEWATSKDTPVGMRRSEDKLSLELEGFSFTTVAAVDNDLWLPTNDSSHANGLGYPILPEFYERVAQRLPDFESPGETFKDAFTGTITASEFKDEATFLSYSGADLDEYFEWLKSGGDFNENLLGFTDAIRNFSPFFTTESGHMGIGPAAMKVGDEVWVLFGGKTLYVVRRIGDHHKFIGECYLHGKMHGAMIDWWQEQNRQPEWVNLR